MGIVRTCVSGFFLFLVLSLAIWGSEWALELKLYLFMKINFKLLVKSNCKVTLASNMHAWMRKLTEKYNCGNYGRVPFSYSEKSETILWPHAYLFSTTYLDLNIDNLWLPLREVGVHEVGRSRAINWTSLFRTQKSEKLKMEQGKGETRTEAPTLLEHTKIGQVTIQILRKVVIRTFSMGYLNFNSQ
ncbi:hypothetical protein I3843_03G210100 [Carya illinoinensis]|nr:hypothetical protein I3843_03G210100 [Carya illinoinensis]